MIKGNSPFPEVELKKDCYYFLCSAGIGDTMLVCGFYEALCRKWRMPIHLLIKPSHEFLMELYGNQNYTVVDFKGISLFKLSDQCKTPEKGKIYVAHPHVHVELIHMFKPIRDNYSTVRFVPWFRDFLGLDRDEPLLLPKQPLTLSPATRRKVEMLAPLDKIAIISPEATSSLGPPIGFWINLARELRANGLTPVSNVIRPENCVEGSCFLNLSIRESIEIAYHCHSVYSLRSGFCDPLYMLGDRLHVFYPSYNSFYIYNMNAMFSRSDIDEQMLPEIVIT